MNCPICKNEFESYDFSLLVNNQEIFFCSELCQAQAKKILTFNNSRMSRRRRRKLLEEIYKTYPIKTKAKKEIVKVEEPEVTKEKTKPKKLNTFGYRLFMERIVAGFSVEDLAKAVGVRPDLIRSYEEGIGTPYESLLKKLAEVLEVSTGKLLPRKK